jgi:CubicO group peptidase (beta-lactamase class C family)
MRKIFKYLLAISLLLSVGSISAEAQKISSKEIDKIVKNTLKSFNVPGIAVAVVKDGKLLHTKGYGITSIETKNKVDENTLFGIASNSKAFTTAALAILVEQNKLSWDDKVRKYIPEFKMYNSYVTEEFTIRDLLTHRSGLGLGAGDLMVFPHISDFTVDDIIHNLPYLKPVSSFRTKYDYDNLLYIVAGEVIARVSGLSWVDFIEKNIMKPLDMKRSAGTFLSLKDTTNIATPHTPVDGKLQVTSRCYSDILNAAGGIYSSVADMSKWVNTQLYKGTFNEKTLFSKKSSYEMWKPQTIKNAWAMPHYKTNFKAYALGWEVCDVNGHMEVSHTGGLPGMLTQVTMIPDMKLGIVVLTNQQSGLAFMAITDAIKDKFLGIKKVDRVKLYKSFEGNRKANNDKISAKVWKVIADSKLSVDTKAFEGTFTDKWWGDVKITDKGGKLFFQSIRSPLMHGEMIFYKGNTFVVKWADRSFKADAYAMFHLNANGEPIGFKMKAISPETDFSFDFHDLEFTR